VSGITGEEARVIIKETFQHPSQVGKLSFPAGKAGDVVRPYTKDTMLRSDLDDDDDMVDEVEDWTEEPEGEAETEVEPRETSLYDAAAAEDTDDNDFEE
jgi:hypothetical protein